MTTENPAPAPAPRRRRRVAPTQAEVQTPSQPRQEAPSAGPSGHTGGASWFTPLRVVVIAVIAMNVYLFQMNLRMSQLRQTLSGNTITQPAPSPTPSVSIPANDTWAAIAQWVEAGQILDTDELVKVGRQLQKSGYLTDISRLDVYAKEKSKPITNDNRAEVLRVIRG